MISLTISLISILILYIIYSVIIKPYLAVLQLTKQGFRSEYYPVLGKLKARARSSAQGDQLAYVKDYELNGNYRGVATNLFNKPIIFLIEPALIKDFHTKQDLYTKPEKLFGLFKEVMGGGLIFIDGSKWKMHRKLISMAFHYEMLKDMIADFGKITQEFYDKIKTNNMKNISIIHEFQAITGEAVGRLFFGEKFSQYNIKGHKITNFLAGVITKAGVVSMNPTHVIFGKNFVKAGYFKDHRELIENSGLFKSTCREIIRNKMKDCEEEYKKGIKAKNLIHLFYEQRLSNPEEALSDDDILGEFITFFLAGMDTVGHLVTMAAYYLIQNPRYKEKLMEEMERYCHDEKNVKIDELNKMEHMTAFMKECLRVASPAPLIFDREALVDHYIGDVKVKAGTCVNTSFMANNYNPNYHNEPKKFLPERWLDAESLTMKSVNANPFIFTPFSVGGRNCLGQHIAINEARVLFSLFLKNFDYEISDKNFKPNMSMRFLYEFEKDLMIDLKAKV